MENRKPINDIEEIIRNFNYSRGFTMTENQVQLLSTEVMIAFLKNCPDEQIIHAYFKNHPDDKSLDYWEGYNEYRNKLFKSYGIQKEGSR